MAMAAQADAGRYFQAFENGKSLLEENQLPHGLDALAVKLSASGAGEPDTQSLLNLYKKLQSNFPQDAELTLAVSFWNITANNWIPLCRVRELLNL